MVLSGDGVISDKTALMLGSSASLDVRVEVLTGGLLRRIPEPTTKTGRLAKMILKAYDDKTYCMGLSAMGINGEALLKAVSSSCLSWLTFFFL